MKRSYRLLRALVALVAISVWIPVLPADEDSGAVNLEEMMAAYLSSSSPGPQHERLKSHVGSWALSIKTFLGKGDPQSTAGTSEASLILGGRFLQEKLTGSMLGLPFEGFRFTGYDNIQKKYISTWIDSLGTGILVLEGSASADGKTITWTGSYPNPLTGKVIGVKLITRHGDEGRNVEMYESLDGKETKTMELVYTRK